MTTTTYYICSNCGHQHEKFPIDVCNQCGSIFKPKPAQQEAALRNQVFDLLDNAFENGYTNEVLESHPLEIATDMLYCTDSSLFDQSLCNVKAKDIVPIIEQWRRDRKGGISAALFDDLVTEFVDDMRKILQTKGIDYAAGKAEADRLYNFFAIANSLSISPLQVWGVFFMKHVTAVQKFVATGRVESEPVHQRLLDIANYCVLLEAILLQLERSGELLG